MYLKKLKGVSFRESVTNTNPSRFTRTPDFINLKSDASSTTILPKKNKTIAKYAYKASSSKSSAGSCTTGCLFRESLSSI